MPDVNFMKIFQSLNSITCKRTGFVLVLPSIRNYSSTKRTLSSPRILGVSMPIGMESYTVNVHARTPDILDQAKLSLERVSVQYLPSCHAFHILNITSSANLCDVQGPILTSRGTDNSSAVHVNFPGTQDHPATLFSPQTFFQHLNTRLQGSILLTTSALPSTQTLLQDNPGHFPNGTICLADRQIKGKGAHMRYGLIATR